MSNYKRKEMNVKDEELFEAVNQNDIPRIRAALGDGANVNARDKYGMSPLFYSIREKDTDSAPVLLELGAGVNVGKKKDDGALALNIAVLRNKPDVIPLLLEHGADVNARGDDGNNALATAALYRRDECKVILIKAGAKLYCNEDAEFLLEARRVEERGEHGRIQDIKLFMYADVGDYSRMRDALDSGADVNARDERGNTALLYAAELCSVEMANMLLERGANVNARDERGNTALMVAIEGHIGSEEMVDMFLGAGADVNMVRRADGMTALTIAERQRDGEVADVLREAQARALAASLDKSLPASVKPATSQVRAVEDLGRPDEQPARSSRPRL